MKSLRRFQIKSLVNIVVLVTATTAPALAQDERMISRSVTDLAAAAVPPKPNDGVADIIREALVGPRFVSFTDAEVATTEAWGATPQTNGSRNLRPQSHKRRVLFEYHPSGLRARPEESESLLVSITVDGKTKAVRYRFSNPAIIAVYEGRLSETERDRLVDRAEALSPKAWQINQPYIGSCDSDSFELSVSKYHRPTSWRRPAQLCLIIMPKEIRDFVDEMRVLWKRMSEMPLAYSYGRAFPANRDLRKAVKREARPLISIGKLSAKLRKKILSMIENPAEFTEISQSEHNQLLTVSGGASQFYIIANRSHYFLTELLLSKSTKSPVSGMIFGKGQDGNSEDYFNQILWKQSHEKSPIGHG